MSILPRIRSRSARTPRTARKASVRLRLALESLESRRLMSLTQPGYYSADGQEPGIPAPPGTYVATFGATAPTPNPFGYYTDHEASVAPIPAPPGSYVDTLGAISPTLAPPGSYVPVNG